jgi:hypothetical protein
MVLSLKYCPQSKSLSSAITRAQAYQEEFRTMYPTLAVAVLTVDIAIAIATLNRTRRIVHVCKATTGLDSLPSVGSKDDDNIDEKEASGRRDTAQGVFFFTSII